MSASYSHKPASFLSIQAQDFIEDYLDSLDDSELLKFLSIQAQDFIEDGKASGGSVSQTEFLSIQAQDFIEDDGFLKICKSPS